MKSRIFLLLAIAIGAVFIGSSTAAATPASGFTVTPLVKGNLAKATEMEALGIHFATEGPTDVIVQQVDFAGRGTSGWHAHPGLVIVTVKSGRLIAHSACRATSYSAGQSFVEPPLEAGMVENALDTPSQAITTLVVPAGRAPRSDVTPAPVCNGTAESAD